MNDDLYDLIMDEIENLKDDFKRYKKSKTSYKSGTTCPKCGKRQCATVDSRYIDGFQQRRRRCENCEYKWNTLEIRI